jgi:hypothetical protein
MDIVTVRFQRTNEGCHCQAVNTLRAYSALLRAVGQRARAAEMESLLARLRQEEP